MDQSFDCVLLAGQSPPKQQKLARALLRATRGCNLIEEAILIPAAVII